MYVSMYIPYIMLTAIATTNGREKPNEANEPKFQFVCYPKIYPSKYTGMCTKLHRRIKWNQPNINIVLHTIPA